MASKHLAVQGATLKCKCSVTPQTDTLKVFSQSNNYANDKDGSKKLIATDKEIGQTLEKNTFGNCKMQPTGNSYLPCQALIIKWSGAYEKLTLSNKGKALLEDSKATCPIGGTDCIEITKHGQVGSASQQNVKNANTAVIAAINPLVDMEELTNDDNYFYT